MKGKSLPHTLDNPPSDVTLHDEDGELLKYKTDKKGNKIWYFIWHFSCYYYEDYT
tara:strand:- start:784 stop:948 length:165 start_codon:yes stop_codon:yes gene_type:complete